MKKIIFTLFLFCLISPIYSVVAAPANNDTLTVLSRGHIQDLGDYPQDGSWVESPNRIGTVGQSKRIEGFELKPGINLPSGFELRYNVHVQNRGWLYDEADPTTWAKNGEYAGTRGESLRIEAIQIVLLDASGNKATGYHVYYQGHVQNVGDLPADSEKWIKDGETLGTVGSSLRLEALKLEIVKDSSNDADLSAYNDLTKKIESFNEADYTKGSWAKLQMTIKQNAVTGKNTQKEVDAAVKIVETAISQLENLTTSTVYGKAGTYGPSSGTETIKQDVIITSRDVTLQNLKIEGNLIIDEAVGDGNVTLNNINVSGELRVRGGGQNSIHINGGDYSKILVEQAPDGGVRIVATGLDGVPVVLSEDAAGETLILEGSFDSVTVSAPDVIIKTQGQTSIKTFDVDAVAKNTAINLGSNTQVTNLALSAPAKVTGTGTVAQAEIASDNVSFEKAPVHYAVDPGVVVPPVIPTPQPQPGGGGSGGGGGYTPPSKISLSVNANSLPSISPKTYDGTTDVYDTAYKKIAAYPVDAAGITGIVAGDDVSVLVTATYNTKNAGTDKTVTYTYSLSGAQADKYSLSGTTKIENCIITQKQLSQPSVPTVTKVFDGNATLSTTLIDNIGQVATDTLIITQTAIYQDSAAGNDAIEVGNSKTVNCTYQLSGADASNYMAPASQTGIGSITKRILNLTWANTFAKNYGAIKTGKTYDGNHAVFYAGAGTVKEDAIGTTTKANFETGVERIVVTANATYDNRNAGSDKTITVNYEISGTTSSKRYQIAPETINQASIAQRQLTVSGTNVPTPQSKTYDRNPVAYTTATDKIVTPDSGNIVSGDMVELKAVAAFADQNAGTSKMVTITYDFSDGTTEEVKKNYSLPHSDTSQTAAITPLTLTVGSINSASKTKEYDGNNSGKLEIGVSCSANPGLFQSEVTGTNPSLGIERSSSYYNSANTVATTETGTGLTIRYTLTLNGTSAGNYAFTGGVSTISDYTTGGVITPKTLTIAPPNIKTTRDYDGTSNVYDTSGKTIAPSYSVEPGQITGLAGQDSVDVTATMTGAGKDAGAQTVTITYSWSGTADSNYLLPAPQSVMVTITPLSLTVSANNVPAVAATRKYDGTTATNVTNTPVAVSGVLTDDATKVSTTATATYTDKNAGSDKDITIAYSLSGDAAKNYQAPAEDTTKKAAITPRILGYVNIALDTMKKWNGTSVVNVLASVDPTKSTPGTDGVVNNSGDEDRLTLSCSADYYYGNDKTSATGQHPIKLSGTLSGTQYGDESGNYVMIDNYEYGEMGEILPTNALITASYSGGSWTSWGKIFGNYQSLTPPNNDSGFKLFMYENTSRTFYGIGSDQKIYVSTDSANLSTWNVYKNGGSYDGEELNLSGYQIFGIDNNGTPLAVDSSGDIYCWLSDWQRIYPVTVSGEGSPINPTYYTDGAIQYLIYQDSAGNIYKTSFSNNTQQIVAASVVPADFSNQLIYYGGSTTVLFAY